MVLLGGLFGFAGVMGVWLGFFGFGWFGGVGGVVLLRHSPVMVLFGGGGACWGVFFRLVMVAREGGSDAS